MSGLNGTQMSNQRNSQDSPESLIQQGSCKSAASVAICELFRGRLYAEIRRQVAIITGSGQGIGKGIAQRLAREGAHVVIAEYNAESAAAAAAEIEAAGGRALAYRVDISDVAAVQRMVDDVAAQLGHIDILVNNAGVVQTKPMLDLTEADWDRVLDVNLRGTFFLVQAVARQMIRQLPESLRAAAAAPADIFSTKKLKQQRPATLSRWPPATARSSACRRWQAAAAARCRRTTPRRRLGSSA